MKSGLKYSVFGGILAALCVAGVYLIPGPDHGPQDGADTRPNEKPVEVGAKPEPSVEAKQAAGVKPFRSLPEGESGKVAEYKPVDAPSRRLSEFGSLPAGKQEQLATDLMVEKDLEGDELAFIRAELYNKKLTDLTRNNLANALIKHGGNDPELHKVFLSMIDDPTDSIVWRDYSLQFLSRTLSFTNDRKAVIKKLKDVAKNGRGFIQGTAMVHLLLRQEDGLLKLDEDFSEQMATTLENSEVSLGTKMTILAVIGKRNDRANLGLLRKYAAQDENASLKRASVAALGSMGDKSDMPVIQAALKHKNRAVILAAMGAEKRLKAKMNLAVKNEPKTTN